MWDCKYRPLRFSDVLGQEGAVAILKSRLKNGTAMDTSYIFSGSSGSGKTTLARIHARAMICENLDLSDPEPCNECDNCKAILDETSVAYSERDAASQGTIDHMRAIVEELPYAVFGASKRLYLLDEAHRLSKDSQDVLLKPIEDKRMVAFFATTEPEKIRGAIRSRCEEHQIRKSTPDHILQRMKMVLAQEQVDYEEEAVRIVVDYCGGQVRDVLMRLETLAQMGPLTVDSVRSNLNLSLVTTYYEILLRLSADTKGALTLIDKTLSRVPPEEVSAGLAEAAMNSFRLANGMLADFAFADKTLGQQVYAAYGLDCVKLAEYFLRSRYATQAGLICDIVSLAQVFGQKGVLPIVEPTRISLPSLEVKNVVVIEAPKVQELSVKETLTPTPKVETVVKAAPVEAPLPKVVSEPTSKPELPKTPAKPEVPLNDPCVFTRYDAQVIPDAPPKTRSHVALDFNETKVNGGSELLTATQWRKTFEAAWLR